MAQTTNGISMKDCKLEGSTNGSTWADISGFAASIETDGGDRQTGEDYTFDGDTAIITKGKREPIDLTAKVVYTEGASDPFEAVRAAYEAGTPYYLRWSPKGGGLSTFQYTTPAGVVTSFPYPGGEAGSADPVMIEFTLKVPYVTKAAVT